LCRQLIAEASKLYFEDAEEEAGRPDFTLPSEADTKDDEFADAPTVPPPLLPPGTRISRYEVRRPIGEGAGGVVYEAWDPQLGRAVALKIVRRGSAQTQQLLHEEQALAKLSHPHVVNVHDAGVFDGGAFLVMELIAGTTFADWINEKPHSWLEIVGAMADAARGLAAAHRVGLVHRDFKPENVIVGKDGRVRVADFGLARSVEAKVSPPNTPAPSATQENVDISSVAGTPLYMAPEQLLGQRADSRSDQFSFCVTLYLALYRQHPFGGDDITGLGVREFARNVTTGQVRPPPEKSDVPPWLRNLIFRGLKVMPDERHPSMDALLEEIARGLGTSAGGVGHGFVPVRRRPTTTAIAIGGVAVLAVVALLLWSFNRSRLRAGLVSHCGNGVVESGETCDDGNEEDTDGCLTTCRWATCGDGHLRANVEECDDGNGADGDGCSATCTRCADGDDRMIWRSNGRCYTRHDRPLPWHEAASACRAIKAHLVSFNVFAELRDVSQRLMKDRSDFYWIGLADKGGNGEYQWITAEPQNPLLVWSKNTPEKGACVAANPKEPVHAALKPWRTASCHEAMGFICEQPEWKVRPATNHAYRQLTPERQIQDAQAACERIGAHLVTIADADESAFVSSEFFGSLWLGAIRTKREEDFRWVTNEPFTFQHFAPGDPDRSGIPNCIVLAESRRWHDRSCDSGPAGPYGVVCEID
jgi:cysteine-rich repeat protein